MNYTISPEHPAEALARAHQHWQERHEQTPAYVPTAFSIAFSRETGTHAAAVARAVGDRLRWPVYDRELLQRIADDLGVRRTFLESVDERQGGWVRECLASFFAVPEVTDVAYYRHLVVTLLSLAARGECVIVGRGATVIMPQATTLRVRVVAPLQHRIEDVQRGYSIASKEAATQVEKTDRERNRFITSHFQIDPTDAANYDLVLNAARFNTAECADLVIGALDRLRARPRSGQMSHALRVTAGV